MTTQHFRIIIIGAGPAGYTAAVYAARAGLTVGLFTGANIGGQLIQATEIENFPGFPEPISGYDLMSRMQAQVQRLEVPTFSTSIVEIETDVYPFVCHTEAHDEYTADAVILATGATARWLGIPGENAFRGYGVSGCATCDGFFYRGKHVVVVGGGNTAVADALFLANQAKQVILVHRRDTLRAEEILQKRLMERSNVAILWNTACVRVFGETNPRRMSGITLRNTLTGEETNYRTDGLFVAIGHEPQTALVKGKVALTPSGYIMTTPGATSTSVPGLFAAGDVADSNYRQAITAAGQGCMAVIDAEAFLAIREQR